jgi:preprotein translocase subunit YajC
MGLLDFLISPAYAQAAPGAEGGPPSLLLMLVVFFGVFYFMVIRPQSKRVKEQRSMLSALAKGDEVLAAGGLMGRVAGIGEQFIELELAPGLVVKVQKQAVTAVLPKGSLKAA